MLPQPDHPIIWKAVHPRFLIWTQWEDTFVVFQRQAGTTHYLNQICHRLVTEVLVTPSTVDQIAAQMPKEDGAESDANYALELEDLLMRLEQLGLVEGT